MAIEERLLDKFIPSEERLTLLEMQKDFPFPIETTTVIIKENLLFLKKFVADSYDAIKEAFKGTSLDYKIEIYKEYIPKGEEEIMDFFKRNRQKVGISGVHDDLMFGIVKDLFIPEKGKTEVLRSLNGLSTRIYTGEKITSIDYHTDEKQTMDENGNKIGYIYSRNACLQEKYEIEFELGFKQDLDDKCKKLWFYSFGYRNAEFKNLYKNLYKELIMRCDYLSQFKKDVIEHKKFGTIEFLI